MSQITVMPSKKKYVIGPDEMTKLLTHLILTVTGKTSTEIGLVGHAAYFDIKDKTCVILSKFDLKAVSQVSKKFGTEELIFPALDPLADYLYPSDSDLTIYELDEKKGIVVFKWHRNLALAAMCNVKLLPGKMTAFEFHPIIKESKKNKDVDRQVPALLVLETRFDNVESYDPKDAIPYLDSVGA